MDFWKMVFDLGCITSERLKGAVKWEKNKYGEITKEEYKEITGVEFTV